MNDKYKDLRDALANFNKYPWSDETRNKIIRAAPGLLAERDALLAQHHTDSKTLREYAQQRDDMRKERDALRAVAVMATDALSNYERMGEVCPFEDQPMIYADTLVEIGEAARITLAQHQGA